MVPGPRGGEHVVLQEVLAEAAVRGAMFRCERNRWRRLREWGISAAVALGLTGFGIIAGPYVARMPIAMPTTGDMLTAGLIATWAIRGGNGAILAAGLNLAAAIWWTWPLAGGGGPL